MALDPISAAARLEMILDAGTMTELNAELIAGDPIAFPGYGEKIAAQREKTGMREALVSAEGCIEGMKAVVCVLDGGFFMGSMGTAVGEKVTLAVEYFFYFSVTLTVLCFIKSVEKKIFVYKSFECVSLP